MLSRRPPGWPGWWGLLLLLLVSGGCERGGGPHATGPAGRAALAEKVEPDQLRDEVVRRFPELFQQAVATAAPGGPVALELLTAAPGSYQEHAVLERVYRAGGAFRFATPEGLTPAGELLQQALTAADDHALDPARYHVPALAELQRAWQAAVAGGVGQLAPPPFPQPGEERLLGELLAAQDPAWRKPGAEEVVVGRLVGEQSPLPRLHQAFQEARATRHLVVQAAARWELALADGLLRYAHDLSRGNTAPAIRLAQQREPVEVQETDEEGAPPDRRAPTPARPAPATTELPLVLRDPQAYVAGLLEADLLRVRDRESLAALLEELLPPLPQYRPLLAALQQYRQFAAAGGWEVVPPRDGLRPGKSHPTVALLKQRLAREGFWPVSPPAASPSSGPPAASPTGPPPPGPPAAGTASLPGTGAAAEAAPRLPDDRFDAGLEQAIRLYQQLHQLAVTGQPHAVFWKSLNVPATRRVQALELTLQRWRESRIGRDPYYVFINIPDFHLEVWKAGQRLLRHRVIVGENRDTACDEETETVVLAHATPLQSAIIENLIFAPYWNVTRSIKEKELDPERARDPLYYQRHGYQVMDEGTPREWVRELPGPSNSLGFVKFIFPNHHSTFVHDTPVKELFDQPVRAFSHGCMRLDQPRQLAELLLTEDGQWEAARFEALYQAWLTMNTKALKTQFDPDRYERLVERAEELQTDITLSRPVPIHIEYYTVRVDEQGRPIFLADIYGYDEQRLNPKPPKRCVPERKAARQGFGRVIARVEEQQRAAVALVPRVLRTLQAVQALRDRSTWVDRHLVKQSDSLQNFAQEHENYAQSIQEAHAKLRVALDARQGRWNKALEQEAVRIERLLRGLGTMNRKAQQLCQQVEARVAELERQKK